MTDIKNAFPCAKLPEPIWMEVPKSAINMYLDPESDHYNLDQYKELKNSYAFISSALYGLGHSPCAFLVLKVNMFNVMMAASFIDDCICVGTDKALNDYHQFMAEGYTISDLGEPTDFLSMQIHYDHKNKSIKIYQEKYIQKIAECFNIQLTANPPKTPLLYDKQLEPMQEGDKLIDPTLFCAICGSITYSAITCRIDIALASICELSKHMVTLNTTHMAEAWQCMSYLQNVSKLGNYVGSGRACYSI